MHRLILAALFGVLLVVSAAPARAQLPPEIQFDILNTRLDRLIAAKDWPGALTTAKAMDTIALKEAPVHRLKLGRALLQDGQAVAAREHLAAYTTRVGRIGPGYKEALGLLLRAEREVAKAEAARPPPPVPTRNADHERALNEATAALHDKLTAGLNGGELQAFTDKVRSSSHPWAVAAGQNYDIYLEWLRGEPQRMAARAEPAFAAVRALIAAFDYAAAGSRLRNVTAPMVKREGDDLVKRDRQKVQELFWVPTARAVIDWLPQSLKEHVVETGEARQENSGNDESASDDPWRSTNRISSRRQRVDWASLADDRLSIAFTTTQSTRILRQRLRTVLFSKNWETEVDYRDTSFEHVTVSLPLRNLMATFRQRTGRRLGLVFASGTRLDMDTARYSIRQGRDASGLARPGERRNERTELAKTDRPLLGLDAERFDLAFQVLAEYFRGGGSFASLSWRVTSPDEPLAPFEPATADTPAAGSGATTSASDEIDKAVDTSVKNLGKAIGGAVDFIVNTPREVDVDQHESN